MYKLLSSFTVISNVYITFTKHSLAQWILKLPGSFEIYWARQYLLHGCCGHSKHNCLQDQTNFRTWQIVLIVNTASVPRASDKSWSTFISLNELVGRSKC